MKKILAILLMTFLVIPLTTAISADESPNWNFISGSYVFADFDDDEEFVDGDSFDPTGYTIQGSGLINDDFALFGSYTSVTDSIFGVDGEVNASSIGVNYIYGLSESTDLFIGVSYEKLEVCAEGNGMGICESMSGYGNQIGIKSMLSEQFEVTAAAKYVDLEDDLDIRVDLSAAYYIYPTFSVGVTVSIYEEANIYGFMATAVF